jgi:glycosyltransferase involved in cell wall biosynthesis
MSSKKTICHFIYNLGRGGAETMLVRVLKELTEYRNIVVTLQDKNNFGNELQCDEYICLNKPSLLSFPLAAIQLKKIIKKYDVDIVHSHLPQCNFVARLAVPAHVPLVTTIHTSIATAVDYKKWYIRLLDQLTYKYRSSIIIAVSNVAMNDYFSVLKLKPHKTFVLYTFVDTEQYKVQPVAETAGSFRIIAVGALRKGKNYNYLIEAFKQLAGEKIELHIYGNGPEKENLQHAIDAAKVTVVLKGQVSNIHEVLANYDLFVMPSLFEGFSLSVLEAMAMQMPMMLSDIPSFKEQCADTAIYFDVKDTGDFVNKFKHIAADKTFRDNLALAAKQRVMNNFTLAHHMRGLQKIYTEVLNPN